MPPADDDAPPNGRPKGPPNRPNVAPEGANDEALLIRLHALEQEHADLGAAIDAFAASPSADSLAVARLKKRKLRLKEEIVRLRDLVIPDIIA